MTRPRYLTYAFLLITAILFCWWYWVTPYYNDDILFTAPWCVQQTGETWIEYNAKSPMTWEGYVYKAYLLFHEDAFRGFNLLAPWFMWLPKCLFNIFTTLFFFGTIIISAKTVDIEFSQYNRIALITMSLILFLPWETGMSCIAHTMNYIWPLFFLALYLYYYKNISEFPLWPLVLCGLILGGGHEMLGLPIFGVTFLTNWDKKTSLSIRKKRWVAAFSALIPTLILLGVAFFGRLNYNPNYFFLHTDSGEDFPDLVLRLLMIAPFCFLCLAILPFAWRRFISNRWLIYLLTLTVLFFFEGLLLNMTGGRAYMWAEYMAIVTFCALGNKLIPRPIILYKWGSLLFYTCILAILSINLSEGIYWTNRLGKEEDIIRREYYYGHSLNQFYQMTPPSHISPLAYHRLCFLFQYYRCNHWGQHMWRKDNTIDEPNPTPVPLILKNFTDDEMVALSYCPEILMARDWYISRDSLTHDNTCRCCLPKGVYDIVSTPFLREDGQKFYFLTFLYNHYWLEGRIGLNKIYAR
ncbi:MAG: DUF6056 family protein [Bacteroidales bacterium]|nr:DUF6056 family protein [Bacteroidales bacterium]